MVKDGASHREVYQRLLSPELRERTLATLRAHGYFESLQARDARVVDAPLPYVRFTVEPSDSFTAYCSGTFLDLAAWPEIARSGTFYLPVIAMCVSAPELDLAHELTHLSDMLDLVERDPTYPERAQRLAFDALDDDADLERLEASIDFEVFKVFALEPHALLVEFEMGRKAIEIPVLFFRLRYRCATADEFVNNWLASYLNSLEQRYRTRSPAHAERIAKAVRAATDRHGEPMFGVGAAAQLKSLFEGIVEKALAQSGLGTKR